MQSKSKLFETLDSNAVAMEQEITRLQAELKEMHTKYNGVCQMLRQASIDTTTLLTKTAIAARSIK